MTGATNELLTRIGPGTLMGHAHAALLDPGPLALGAAGAGRTAIARPPPGRRPRCVSR